MYSLPASFSQSDESPHDVMLPPVQSHDGSVEDGTVVPGARLVVAGTDDVAVVTIVDIVATVGVAVAVDVVVPVHFPSSGSYTSLPSLHSEHLPPSSQDLQCSANALLSQQ